MDDMPAAPAAPAASPAPTAAPAAAPAASSTPAPAATQPSAPGLTSSTVLGREAPAAMGSGAVDIPADGSAAATDAAPAAPAEPQPPKPEEFDSNEEYLAAKWAYEDEHGGVGTKEGEAAADPNAPAQEAKTEEELAAEAAAEPALPAEPKEPATPEALAGMLDSHPALKSALEAAPDVKEQLFAMARENAQFRPVADIFPDVESARFANETAGTFVELQTSFQMAAEDPESFPEAFAKFENLFRLRDEKGEYVRDAQGNIKVGEDFNLLGQHLVNGYHQGELKQYGDQAAALQQKLESAVYPNEAAKEADRRALDRAEMAVAALNFVAGLAQGEGEQKPDLSSIADPEVRAYYERKEAELEADRKALGKAKGEGAVNARRAERKAFDTRVEGAVGGEVGKRLRALLDEKIGQGTFIPSYVLEDRLPGPLDQHGNETPGPHAFAVACLKEWRKAYRSVPLVMDNVAKLNMLPPTQANFERRTQYFNELIERFLPKVLDAQVAKVQAKERTDRAERTARSANRGNVVQQEPRSGATPQPQTMNADQLEAKARENAAKRSGFRDLSLSEQNTARLEEKLKLQFG